MLHLIGENLDKSRAHYQAETGKLVQLVRGIYADADDNIDDLVLRHAVRIAHYLYPRAYLAAASSVLLVATRDGRLLISGPRSQRTRIRSLEIIQNKAPQSPSTAMGFIKDGLGEFQMSISTIRQRFLEAFRLQRFSTGLDEVSLSFLLEIGENEAAVVEQMLSLCRQRLEDFS